MIDGAIHSKQDRGQINPDESEDFASMAVRLEAPDLLKAVDRFLGQGGSVESAFVDLLAPAARHLGEMWEQDECDFVDVTMGLWRLQEVMREISLRSPPEPAPLRGLRSAVFCPVPGDTHSFGAQMIEEVFARAGWQSEVLVSPERRELLDHVARSPVDLVGLTVSSKTSVSALSSLVKSIKGVSLNPHTCVLVGGSVINQNPELVTEIGADGTGRDANSALETAERLVAAAPVRAQSFV
ncbi:MAG: cobalamin B12-binding domain-containing protein [Pseudomonadota bacterium]